MTDFRAIPSIDELRRRPAVRALEEEFGADATVDALRAAASEVRAAIVAKARLPTDKVPATIEAKAVTRVRATFRSRWRDAAQSARLHCKWPAELIWRLSGSALQILVNLFEVGESKLTVADGHGIP